MSSTHQPRGDKSSQHNHINCCLSSVFDLCFLDVTPIYTFPKFWAFMWSLDIFAVPWFGSFLNLSWYWRHLFLEVCTSPLGWFSMLFWFLLGNCYDEVYFSSDDFNLGYAWSRLKQLEFWLVTASVVFKVAKTKKEKTSSAWVNKLSSSNGKKKGFMSTLW